MVKIKIKEEFKHDWITRSAGEKLRHMILSASKKGEGVEIDFSGVIVASTSFFDEGFGKLVQHGWTKEKLYSTVVLKNLNKRDMDVLNEMCRNRKMT